MKRKACIGAFVACLLSLSCGRPDFSEAGEAAAVYYGYLVEGQYSDYVKGIAYCDSMTDSYRSQMVDLVAQYAARERDLHGGIVSVRPVREAVTGETANVMLEILLGDSTCEEIAVPMVKCGEVWKMQ